MVALMWLIALGLFSGLAYGEKGSYSCQCVGGKGQGNTCTSKAHRTAWCYVTDPKACQGPSNKDDKSGTNGKSQGKQPGGKTDHGKPPLKSPHRARGRNRTDGKYGKPRPGLLPGNTTRKEHGKPDGDHKKQGGHGDGPKQGGNGPKGRDGDHNNHGGRGDGPKHGGPKGRGGDHNKHGGRGDGPKHGGPKGRGGKGPKGSSKGSDGKGGKQHFKSWSEKPCKNSATLGRGKPAPALGLSVIIGISVGSCVLGGICCGGLACFLTRGKGVQASTNVVGNAGAGEASDGVVVMGLPMAAPTGAEKLPPV